MKVHLGPYVDWVGPYQVAEKVFFWCGKYPEKELEQRWDYRAKEWLGDFLAYGPKGHPKDIEWIGEDGVRRHKWARESRRTWFHSLCVWIHSKKKRKMVVKIDYWDHWNLDATLSPIILPLLKSLKEHKHGSGHIDLEDVPQELRYTETEEYDSQLCFDFYHDEGCVKNTCDIHRRYEWVLDEMIWAFEQLQPDCDWEDQYSTGEIDHVWVDSPTGNVMAYQLENGPDHTYKVDWEGRRKHQERINNGLKLFGKYFQTLWD